MKILSPEYKHSDSRRTLTQVLTAPVSQVNEYHAKRGSLLGNHSHPYHEYFHLIKGILIYNESNVISKGSTFVVEPDEKHTLECLTDVHMMAFLEQPFKK